MLEQSVLSSLCLSSLPLSGTLAMQVKQTIWLAQFSDAIAILTAAPAGLQPRPSDKNDAPWKWSILINSSTWSRFQIEPSLSPDPDHGPPFGDAWYTVYVKTWFIYFFLIWKNVNIRLLVLCVISKTAQHFYFNLHKVSEKCFLNNQ